MGQGDQQAEPTVAEVAKWFDSESKWASKFESLLPLEIHSRTCMWSSRALPPEGSDPRGQATAVQIREFDRIGKAAIAQHADTRLWWVSTNEWRVASDPIVEQGQTAVWTDNAWTPRLAWNLHSTGIVLVDPRANVPKERDPRNGATTVFNNAAYLITSGLRQSQAWKLKHGEPQKSPGGLWKIESSQADKAMTFEIRWDSARGAGRIERIDLVNAGRPGSYVFSEWREVPVIGVTIPHRFASIVEASGLVIECEIVTMSRLDEEKGRQLLVPPEEGNDPIRGSLTYTSRLDYRPGKGTAEYDTGGIKVSQQLDTGESFGLRWLGWIVGSLACGLLVWIAVRRFLLLRSQ